MQTKVVTTSFKAMQPQRLSPLVTTGLLGVNRHLNDCYSTRSLISALDELFYFMEIKQLLLNIER